MEKYLEEEHNPTLEEIYSENILMTTDLLERFPKHFQQIVLDDNTEVAVLYKSILLPEEVKNYLSEYEYFALSKYGITQFSNQPLNCYMQKDAIQQLLQKSLDTQEDIENTSVELKRFLMKPKTRRTKGLRQLKATARPFEISGKHSLTEAKDFYESITILLTPPKDLI